MRFVHSIRKFNTTSMSIQSYFKPKEGLGRYLPVCHHKQLLLQTRRWRSWRARKELASSVVSTGGEINYLYWWLWAIADWELCLFCRYSPNVRADIGRYACQHGIAAAARFFRGTSVTASVKQQYTWLRRRTWKGRIREQQKMVVMWQCFLQRSMEASSSWRGFG